MKLPILDYKGGGITANNEAWFNATEIAAMFGKQAYEWLRLPETERYIAALCKREEEQQENSRGLGRKIIKFNAKLLIWLIKTDAKNSVKFQSKNSAKYCAFLPSI